MPATTAVFLTDANGKPLTGPNADPASASYSKGAYAILTGTLAGVNASVGDGFEARDLQSVSVQIYGTFVGTFIFEVSNNGADWVTRALTSSAGLSVGSQGAPGVYAGDIGARYFRVRMSAYTSGSAAITMLYSALSTAPPAVNSVTSNVTQLGGGNIGIGAGSVGTGVQRVVEASAGTAVVTSPTLAAGTSGVLLAANAARAGGAIYNNTGADLYIKLGANASAASFITIIPNKGYYELPAKYNGVIHGFASAAVATGAIMVTEIS